VRAAWGPAHLLLLDHALGDHSLSADLDERGGPGSEFIG
jgi:hypothetical protein